MAEAVLETLPAQVNRFYCHTCSQEIDNITEDYKCPVCSNGFIEELLEQQPTPSSAPMQEGEQQNTSQSQYADNGNYVHGAFDELAQLVTTVTAFDDLYEFNDGWLTRQGGNGNGGGGNGSNSSSTSTSTGGGGGSVLRNSPLSTAPPTTSNASGAPNRSNRRLIHLPSGPVGTNFRPNFEILNDLLLSVGLNSGYISANDLSVRNIGSNSNGAGGSGGSNGGNTGAGAAIAGLGLGGLTGLGGTPMFVMGNPADYAWGREGLDTIVTQLLNQMDCSGPPPLSKEKIDAIPVIAVTNEQLESKQSCSTCWEDFQSHEMVRQLPCLHIYHENCIIPWLELHGTCPICRKTLLSSDEQAAAQQTAQTNFARTVIDLAEESTGHMGGGNVRLRRNRNRNNQQSRPDRDRHFSDYEDDNMELE